MFKYKLRIILVGVLHIVLIVLSLFAIIFITNGYMEKGMIDSEIQQFKNRGIFQGKVLLQGQNVDMYKVNAYYEYEIKDTRKVLNLKYENGSIIFVDTYLGSKADITLTSRNPLRRYNVSIVRDIAGFFAKNFYVGHATMNTSDTGDKMIESVGNDDGFYGVRIVSNSWIQTEVRYGNDAQTIIGLRIKNISNDERDDLIKKLNKTVGLAYNMNFLISKKDAYYCTDLLTRIGKEIGLNLNYDGFFATGSDIIISDDTFITFICQRISEGNFEIYYLEGDQ